MLFNAFESIMHFPQHITCIFSCVLIYKCFKMMHLYLKNAKWVSIKLQSDVYACTSKRHHGAQQILTKIYSNWIQKWKHLKSLLASYNKTCSKKNVCSQVVAVVQVVWNGFLFFYFTCVSHCQCRQGLLRDAFWCLSIITVLRYML